MLVVAERFVLRLAAAAQRGARQRLDGSVLMPDLDPARHQQRSVAHWRDRGLPIRILLGAAVEPPIKQGAARASPDDVHHLFGSGGVRLDPRTPVELEDLPLSAKALADVDADVQVKADLDVTPPVDLSHGPKIEGRGGG